jgi:signal transduction histidine kinase
MDQIGLGAAVAEWLEDQVEKRHGLKTKFDDTISEVCRKHLDPTVRALLFRNVRELLTNVVKHSRASRVKVSLSDPGDEVTIVVEDDGVGFDPAENEPNSVSDGGFGLFSIQERMTDMGGACVVRTEPGKGCRVELTVPVGKGDGLE